MAKKYAEAFYNSDAWKKTRNAYYRYKRGECERCKAEYEAGKRSLNDIQPGKIVHHKRHITPNNINDPSVTLAFENLELLCADHHNKHHKASNRRRYTFATDGRILPIE